MSDANPHNRRTSRPHRRLRNLYIALFLLLGAALCTAEVIRQQSFRDQIAIVDFGDMLRDQGRRISEIGADGFALTYRAADNEAAMVIGRIRQQAAAVRARHEALLRIIDADRALPESATSQIRAATPVLDELEAALLGSDQTEVAIAIRPLVEEYRAALQSAASTAFDTARIGTRNLAVISLTIFAVIAALLLIEALFLIIPATHNLQRQWRLMASQERQTARLSDKFKGLIESTSRIDGLDRSDDGTRIVLDRVGDDREPVVFDFTQLRAVQASLQLFEAAVTNSTDGMILVEHAGEPSIIYCNDAMLRLSGLSMEQLIGTNPLNLHSMSETAQTELLRSIESFQPISLVTSQTRPDGSRYHTELDCVPVSIPGRDPRHCVLVYRDITTRQETLAALEGSLDRFELIGRVSLDGIYDLDLITGFCWRNEPLLRNFGRPNDHENFFDWLHGRVHPEDADHLVDSFASFIHSDRSSWQSEYRQMRTDGSWARVRDRAMLRRDENGKPVRLIGSLQDITEQRERKWDLLQSENRLREILNDQTELVCRYDHNGILTFVNHAYADYFQRSAESLIGTAYLELLPESEWPEAARVLRELSPENPITVSEHRVVLPDGSLRWQRWTDRVILDADGQIKAYQAVGRDVTEEILAKRELEQAQSRYLAFIRNSTEAIFRIEVDPPVDCTLVPEEQAQLIFERGVIAEANDAFSEQYGRETAADSIGLTLRDLLGEDTENLYTLVDFVRSSYLTDDLISHEFKADGTPVIFSNSTVGIVEDGRLVRIWGTQRNITEQRRAEQQLRQTNIMLELFTEHAPAAVAMLDTDMRYVVASRRWIVDFGLQTGDISGMRHYDLFPEIPEEWRELHRRGLRGETLAGEDSMVGKDGSLRWHRWEIRPWNEPSGSVGGIMIFTEDTTDVRRNADHLREVNAQQIRLLTELDHRVKNALGGLINLIEMGTEDAKDVGEYAKGIARRVRSMASVHAMLSESSWKPLSLTEIVKNITPGDTPGRLEYRGPDILVPAEQATPLAMVLQELVSNSMKYGALSSPGGRVHLNWTCEEKNSAETTVTLHWAESGGPPVPPDPSPGLGTQLITGFTKFELRGSIDMDYSSPEGVRHTLRCRLISDHN